MRKKFLMIFTSLSLLVLGGACVAVSPIGNMSNILAKKGQIINYSQTFDHLDEKNGQLGLTTTNGNFIKVNAPSKSNNGLVALNTDEEFSLADPIGGIISMSLEMSVGGKTYPGEGLNCPYELSYAYLIDPNKPETQANWNIVPSGYQNEYVWGQDKAFETPSFLMLTALKDDLLIKSMTLTYNCSHLAGEDAIDQNAIYLLFEDQPYPGFCANGQKGIRQGDQYAFYVNLYMNDTFYFKKPHGEKMAINLANDGEAASNAILQGYASYNAETYVFTALKDIDLGIFIKDSGVTYVSFNKLIEQDWYVTGANLTLSDTPVNSCWGETREDAIMESYEYWMFTYDTFKAQAGENPTLLKLMSGDKKTWFGYDNVEDPAGICEKDNDGNIKFIKSGIYRIDLYLEMKFEPYITINYLGAA